MNIDIIGSFNKETAIDYRVFYTTDYFEWLKDLHKTRGEKITLKELHNNLIKEWRSLEEIYNVLNFKKSGISNNLNDLSKSSHGYIWRYKLY